MIPSPIDGTTITLALILITPTCLVSIFYRVDSGVVGQNLSVFQAPIVWKYTDLSSFWMGAVFFQVSLWQQHLEFYPVFYLSFYKRKLTPTRLCHSIKATSRVLSCVLYPPNFIKLNANSKPFLQ